MSAKRFAQSHSIAATHTGMDVAHEHLTNANTIGEDDLPSLNIPQLPTAPQGRAKPLKPALIYDWMLMYPL
ncbi:hypothetical protein STEG23_012180 [Scotinomys teguina]